VAWDWENLKYLFPSRDNIDEDQKASFGLSYLFPSVGFEVYGELGIDDFVFGGPEGYLRYPFHTMTFAAGIKKTMAIVPSRNIYGTIIFEWNSMEMSQDFQFQWPYSFYFHHNIRQGYTNKGQIMGAGSGSAGNSQYLEFKLYYPQGFSSLFITRNNPDNNYIFSKAITTSARDPDMAFRWENWEANFNVGLTSLYYITRDISIGGAVIYNLIINPLFGDKRGNPDIFMPPQTGDMDDNPKTYMHNISLNLYIRYSF
jgi:hypothetical protein